jgi:CheY-like chemotaxis protein
MRTIFADPPEEFTELVRDALLNVYDPTVLQRHPLLTVIGDAEASAGGRGRLLRQALLEAVNALHPGTGVAITSRAWRTFRILELRYLEGHEAATVSEQVALSKSQYHREHHRALQAVAALLWERWRLADRWQSPGASGPAHAERTQTRLEVERLRPAPGAADRIDLTELAHGLRQILQPLCAERNIALDLVLPDSLPAIKGERVMLRQALLTILIHAVTTATHGPVRAVFAARGRHVEIEISGSGPERLAPDQLGLSESRPFVEALQGSLRYLPVADPPEGWTIQISLPSSLHATLLVVDNNADFVRLIQRYLSDDQWEVIGAADVDQAIASVQQQPPQAILLDVVLPGRDGWELLLELKSRPATKAIPVLVCSVLDEPAMALALGAAAYLHKPVDQRQLVARLTSLG